MIFPGERIKPLEEYTDFDKAIEAYCDRFNVDYPPLGISYPKLDTEMLMQCVDSGVEIAELPIPEGAVS